MDHKPCPVWRLQRTVGPVAVHVKATVQPKSGKWKVRRAGLRVWSSPTGYGCFGAQTVRASGGRCAHSSPPSTPRWHTVVENATTEPQLA
eukprot:5827018-Prymnesium_polylepis.2